MGTWLEHGKQIDLLLLPEINFPGFKPLQLEAGPALQACHIVEVMGQKQCCEADTKERETRKDYKKEVPEAPHMPSLFSQTQSDRSLPTNQK